MRAGERGFTTIELVVATSLGVMIALAVTTFTFHAVRTAEQTERHLTVVSDAANAGYWINRDASMADNVITDSLTPPTFLILKWTEWGYGTANVYHTATYSIENISNGVGQLKRRHQDSGGTDQQTVVANYIYYNAADPTNSTSVTYQTPTINLKVATQFGGASEVKKYQAYRRPNF